MQPIRPEGARQLLSFAMQLQQEAQHKQESSGILDVLAHYFLNSVEKITSRITAY